MATAERTNPASYESDTPVPFFLDESVLPVIPRTGPPLGLESGANLPVENGTKTGADQAGAVPAKGHVGKRDVSSKLALVAGGVVVGIILLVVLVLVLNAKVDLCARLKKGAASNELPGNPYSESEDEGIERS